MTPALAARHVPYTRETAGESACTPFWFDAGDQRCAAFWHQASRGQLDTHTSVVLCPSLMFEQLRGARHQRALARLLASAGFSTLRFSFPGNDNSSGHALLDGDEGSLLPAWLHAVTNALAIVRAQAGTQRVIVVGRRAGGLIALNALRAADASSLAGIELLLWEPPHSGASFLREVRARKRLYLAAQQLVDDLADDASAPTLKLEQSYVFNRATVQELERLALLGELPVPVRVHVVAARIERHVAAVLAEWPAERCASHIVADAAFNFDQWEGPAMPVQTLAAIAAIVRGTSPAVARNPDVHTRDTGLELSRMIATSGSVQCTHQLELPTLGIQEEWVRIEASSHLAALLSMPRVEPRQFITPLGSPPRARVLLLLGTGTDGTAGNGDSNVRLARRVASAGIPVLRLDCSGIGESPALSAGTENRCYEVARTREITAAARWIRERYPDARIVVMGLCSGAFYAVHAAAEGLDIDEVIAVNPQLYWDPALTDLSTLTAVKSSQRAMSAATNASKWRKLVNGKYSLTSLWSAAMGTAARLREAVVSASGKQMFADGLPRLNLETLFPTRTRFHLVFSSGDFGYAHLMRHGEARLHRLNRDHPLAFHIFPGADHTFSSVTMRAPVDALAMRILGV